MNISGVDEYRGGSGDSGASGQGLRTSDFSLSFGLPAWNDRIGSAWVATGHTPRIGGELGKFMA